MTRRSLLAAAAVAPFTQPAPTEIWGGLVRLGESISMISYHEGTGRTWRAELIGGKWIEWEVTS